MAVGAVYDRTRIRLRIDDEPIEEHVDGARHHLDGVECAVVDRVGCSLDKRERCRHTGVMELSGTENDSAEMYNPVLVEPRGD